MKKRSINFRKTTKSLLRRKYPCVPANINENEDDNSNNKKIVLATTITEPLASTRKIEQQVQDGQECSHKGENSHSKNIEKEEIRKHKEKQLILLKENKQNIIDFLSANKDSIIIEDLKVYEPIYKCYREKGNCQICNNYNNNKHIYLCANHCKQKLIDNQNLQLIR